MIVARALRVQPLCEEEVAYDEWGTYAYRGAMHPRVDVQFTAKMP
jgi:hypothetical protein